MNLLQRLLVTVFPTRRAVHPFQQTEVTPPHENYAGYTNLPNLPMGSAGDYAPDPYRLHSPFMVERSKNEFRSNAGVHFYDGADEAILSIPDQSLQQYFNQKKTVEPQVILVPAHGVFQPDLIFQRGFMQQFIDPTEGPRTTESGAMPPVLLSTPLRVGTPPIDYGKRTPMVGKAPRPKKGA